MVLGALNYLGSLGPGSPFQDDLPLLHSLSSSSSCLSGFSPLRLSSNGQIGGKAMETVSGVWGAGFTTQATHYVLYFNCPICILLVHSRYLECIETWCSRIHLKQVECNAQPVAWAINTAALQPIQKLITLASYQTLTVQSVRMPQGRWRRWLPVVLFAVFVRP